MGLPLIVVLKASSYVTTSNRVVCMTLPPSRILFSVFFSIFVTFSSYVLLHIPYLCIPSCSGGVSILISPRVLFCYCCAHLDIYRRFVGSTTFKENRSGGSCGAMCTSSRTGATTYIFPSDPADISFEGNSSEDGVRVIPIYR